MLLLEQQNIQSSMTVQNWTTVILDVVEKPLSNGVDEKNESLSYISKVIWLVGVGLKISFKQSNQNLTSDVHYWFHSRELIDATPPQECGHFRILPLQNTVNHKEEEKGYLLYCFSGRYNFRGCCYQGWQAW